jgi:hypothetical protein
MASLTDKEEKCLRLFMQLVKKLLESSIVTSQKKSLGVMSETVFTGTPETTVVFDGYDEEAFLAFFSMFRQFTMAKEEAVYFKDVCQVMIAKCVRPELTAWVNVATQRWDDVLNSNPPIGFTFNNESYSNAKLLKLWLYGGRFHTDLGKTDLWNSLPEKEQKHVELCIQVMVPKLVNCLVIVGSVIDFWLDATTAPVPPAPSK